MVKLLISRSFRLKQHDDVREDSMAALLWLLIPLAAAVVASVWGGLAARRRTVVPDVDGVAGYERFRQAMERSGRVPAAATTPGTTDGPAREAG